MRGLPPSLSCYITKKHRKRPYKLIFPQITTGTMEPGNKMDATNLATLFAPNLLHTFADEPGVPGGPQKGSSGFAPAAIISALPAKQTPERMEYVSAVRMLIDKREAIFEIPPEELHDVYLSFYEGCPEMLDALLRRRCYMAGNE